MGDPAGRMIAYLSGDFIMPGVRLTITGSPIIPLVNNIDIAGDGTIITYKGNIQRAPDYKKAVSVIKAAVEAAKKSPIENLTDYVAPVEESPVKIEAPVAEPVEAGHLQGGDSAEGLDMDRAEEEDESKSN